MEKENILIKVMKGKARDIDEIELLYDKLNDFLEREINYPGWKKGVYPIKADAIKGINEGDLYVAKYKDKIVGTVILNHEYEEVYDSVQWKTNNNYGEILVVHTLAVNPNYFKLGVAKNLMSFAVELAKNLNMKSIRLDVNENNKPAIKLYEKFGYVYINTVDLGLSGDGVKWFKLYEKII